MEIARQAPKRVVYFNEVSRSIRRIVESDETYRAIGRGDHPLAAG